MEKLVQLDTGYACAGIMIQAGIVTNAAPIFRWMVGKEYKNIIKWKNIKKIRQCY